MSLDINEARKVFADHLQANFHKSKSLDSALMAVVIFSYEAGMKDGPKSSVVVLDNLAWQDAQRERVDCSTCTNRGRIDGLSQETHCDHCIYQEKWRTDHYVSSEA